MYKIGGDGDNNVQESEKMSKHFIVVTLFSAREYLSAKVGLVDGWWGESSSTKRSGSEWCYTNRQAGRHRQRDIFQCVYKKLWSVA